MTICNVNSRLRVLGETTYLGGKCDAFFNIFYVLSVFPGGIWDSEGEFPQEIAGINTGQSVYRVIEKHSGVAKKLR